MGKLPNAAELLRQAILLTQHPSILNSIQAMTCFKQARDRTRSLTDNPEIIQAAVAYANLRCRHNKKFQQACDRGDFEPIFKAKKEPLSQKQSYRRQQSRQTRMSA